jgi:hypothetical protein
MLVTKATDADFESALSSSRKIIAKYNSDLQLILGFQYLGIKIIFSK